MATTEKPTDEDIYYLVDNKCLHCDKFGIIDGDEVYDPCIGKLEGVMNACCGHGHTRHAYVQFSPEKRIAGQEAIDYIKKERRHDQG